MASRIQELDALRGVALIFMVIYHIVVFIYFFEVGRPDLWSGLWIIIARIAQILFLGLVGLSLHLSNRDYLEQIRRAIWILAAAMFISIVSALVLGEQFIRFGILHFIFVAILLVRPLKGYRVLALLLGVFALWYGPHFKETAFAALMFSPWDTFYLFPWIALPLFGLFIGESLYAKKEAYLPRLKILEPLAFLGRHSLLIYLLHLPLLYISFSYLITLQIL